MSEASPDQSLDPPAFPSAGLVRRLRRHLDLSQRELASRSSATLSTIARIESGRAQPTLLTLTSLLWLADWELVAIDEHGGLVEPLLEWDQDLRDGAGRQYPSHLDVILDPRYDEWWGYRYGLSAPPETFRRDRAERDRQRARSQWSVGRRRQRR